MKLTFDKLTGRALKRKISAYHELYGSMPRVTAFGDCHDETGELVFIPAYSPVLVINPHIIKDGRLSLNLGAEGVVKVKLEELTIRFES